MRKVLLLTLTLLFGLSGISNGQGRYTNRKYGFGITSPEKWTRIPLKPDERWVVARFKSNREYPCEDGWSEHAPMMKVILFPKKKEKETGSLEKAKENAEKKKEAETVTITFINPYKDYKDYLKKTFYGGGYYISTETSGTHKGIPVTRLEIKVEKLARYGKQRIITWIFHAPIGDFAVHTDILEDKYAKLRSMIYNSLKTFTLVRRKRGTDDDTDPGEIKIPVFREEMTTEERKKLRMEYTEKVFKKARADLPPGWNVTETRHFLVIYHCPTSKALRYANQAETCRVWLNKTFGKIGKEYVSRCILRICKNSEEESAYSSGSFSFSFFGNREIVTNVAGGDRKWEFEHINTAVMRKFFADKNEDLWYGLPRWLESGLNQYVGTAVASGKRLNFKPDTWEKERLRDARRTGGLYKVKDLMLMTYRDTSQSWEESSIYRSQCGSVVRFLFGPGNRGITKNIVHKYIENLIEVLEEKKKREEAERKKRKKELEKEKGKKGPKTEEEEEEEYRKKKTKASGEERDKKKREILKKTLDMTFGKWREAHWKMFDRSWDAWAK